MASLFIAGLPEIDLRVGLEANQRELQISNVQLLKEKDEQIKKTQEEMAQMKADVSSRHLLTGTSRTEKTRVRKSFPNRLVQVVALSTIRG